MSKNLDTCGRLLYLCPIIHEKAEKMENLVFGWVSPQIQGNYAAWSNWKKYGDEDVARAFYNETCEEAAGQGLTWFCLQDEQYE